MDKAPALPVENIEKKILSPKAINFGLALLALIICLGVGNINFYFSHRFLPPVQLMAIIGIAALFAFFFVRDQQAKPPFIIYGLTVALLLTLGLAVVHSLKEDFEALDIFAMGCAFFVPVLIAEAWFAFDKIRPLEQPAWVYSADIPAESKLAYFENKQLRVKLILNNRSRILPASVPSSLSLGEGVFHVVKKDKDDHGEDWRPAFIGADGEPYEWIFYSNKFGLIKKYYDPYETVFHNGLRPNQIIIVQRVE